MSKKIKSTENLPKIAGLKDPSQRPDLILINSPINDYNKIPKPDTEELPAFGLAYIATECEASGFNVGVLDAESLALSPEQTAKIINKVNPRWVGINMLTPTYYLARRILANLNPDISIIVGGAHAKALPEKVLRDSLIGHRIKLVVLEDGEYIVKGILANTNPQEMEGVAYLNADGEFVYKPHDCNGKWIPKNLDSLNFADRKFLLGDPFESQGKLETNMVGSRGCPFNCNFCAGSQKTLLFGVRRRTPENIIKELKILRTQGINAVRFIDDLFLSDKNYIERFSKNMVESGLNNDFVWDATGRVNILSELDENLFKLMALSGCREIAIGIESASQRILNLMEKKITPEMVKTSIIKLARVGICTKGYFILGYPSETREEMKLTVNFMHELRELARKETCNPNKGYFRGSMFEFRPYPGTLIYDCLTGKKPWSKDFWGNSKSTPVYSEDEVLSSFRPVFMEGLEERQKHNYSTDHTFANGVLPYEIQDIISNAMKEQKKDMVKHKEHLHGLRLNYVE